jgi:hypothetical protein
LLLAGFWVYVALTQFATPNGTAQKKRHASPVLHLTFATQMARLVPDNDWTEITKP